MKRLIALTIALAIFAIPVLACGTDTTGTNTGTAVTVTPAKSTPTASTKTFKVGDTVSLDNWQVQVHSVKTDKGGEFNQPQKAGDLFLLIDVTVTNMTGKSQSVSSIGQFSLKDETGQTYNVAIDANAPSSPDGTLANGAKLRGTLAYEIPNSLKTVQLIFTPDYLSQDQATWDLTV